MADDMKSAPAVHVDDVEPSVKGATPATAAQAEKAPKSEKAPKADKAPKAEKTSRSEKKAEKKSGRKSDKDAAAPVIDRQSAGDDLRELGGEELVARLLEAKEELFNLRFQLATGQMDNNRRVRTVRHDIARIYTVMRERELGLSVGPDGVAGQEGAA